MGAKPFSRQDAVLSLESFPPKTGAGRATFWFADTSDLFAAVRALGSFTICASAEAKRHLASANWHGELDVIKRKVDAGARHLIRQLFFENDHFEALMERLARAGIGVPVCAGIMPIYTVSQSRAFAQRCRRAVPDIHIHTMNRAEVACAIADDLGRSSPKSLAVSYAGAPP